MTISYTVYYQPDGVIRRGSHAFVGNNIFNADGTGQTQTLTPVVGARVLFRIAVQNDGNAADRFTIHATGAVVSGYRIRYYWKSHEITSSVVAGTYTTRLLAPGHRFGIEAWVMVLTTPPASVSRLVTLTSVTDGSKVDAVKFIVDPQP